MRLALVGDEPHGAALGVGAFHTVADAGARPSLLALPDHDHIAGLLPAGLGGLGAGEPAWIQHARDHRVLAELGRGELGEVPRDDGKSRLPVRLLGNAAASLVERSRCGVGIASTVLRMLLMAF